LPKSPGNTRQKQGTTGSFFKRISAQQSFAGRFPHLQRELNNQFNFLPFDFKARTYTFNVYMHSRLLMEPGKKRQHGAAKLNIRFALV
jgi:hypothetical protein